MSTKCTIGHSDEYHLYEECFDSEKVWLRLDGSNFDVSFGANTSLKDRTLTVGIDVAVWRQVVESWLKSHWAQHPERDYEKPDLDLDGFEEMLEKLALRKTTS